MNLARKIRKNLAAHLPTVQTWLLSGFQAGEIETIAGFAAARAGRHPSQPLVVFARALVTKASVVPNHFTDDGEQALLDRLAGMPLRVLFDVGANVGIWSTYALQVFADADVHAFEIVPATFAELQRRLSGSRIHLNRLGLNDRAGLVPVNIYSSAYISSMLALDTDTDIIDRVECQVERGADYAALHGIDRIDILKIDVEGAEGKVLAGFEPMISERRVRLIQFEYNRGAILGDFLLKNAYEFFTPRGYRLGRLAPEGVYFHSYHYTHEDFLGPNYVACLDDDAELISLISTQQ
ncbi:MAG: FkbM family methyltransferase [Stellaceae bacterium]